MTLKELQERALTIARSKGFFPKSLDHDGALEATVPKSISHMHSEVSELYEEYRSAARPEDMNRLSLETPESTVPYHANCSPGLSGNSYQELLQLAREGFKPVGPAAEAADIAIQLAELTAWLGIDLDRAVEIKLAYYATRPYLNGKAR